MKTNILMVENNEMRQNIYIKTGNTKQFLQLTHGIYCIIYLSIGILSRICGYFAWEERKKDKIEEKILNSLSDTKEATLDRSEWLQL